MPVMSNGRILREFLEDMPLPTCAVCGKPVDMMRQFVNQCTATMDFIVECHGEIETVTVEEKMFLALGRGDRIGIGEAFVSKKLPDPTKALPSPTKELPE